MKIEQLDPNFAADSMLGLENAVYYDVRQAPFQLYGLYEPYTQPEFVRLPPELAVQVNEGVAELYKHTAGGRVRFSTDSDYVAIRWKMKKCELYGHMAASGSRGFDLYEELPSGESIFRHLFKPPVPTGPDGTGSSEGVIHFPDRRLRCLTINFPLYHDVTSVAIGVRAGSEIGAGAPYRDCKPVIYYGSSITQGGCASRPGNSYEAMISRRLNCDYYNFGFSGSGKAEDNIVEYLAAQEASVFVMDYDHNAPNADYLRATHEKMYRKLRAAHPHMPIIMVSRPDDYTRPHIYRDLCRRREVVFDTFRKAQEEGDRLVCYIDGESLFAGLPRCDCTVDGTHPNDLGFYGMAKVIGDAVARYLPGRF